MRFRRLLAAVTTTLVAGPTLAVVATAAPASAATATHIVGSDGGSWISASSYASQPGAPVYGDSLSLSIEVVNDAGDQVYGGTLTVERQLAGQSTWSTVATSPNAYLYDSIKAAGNAVYRVTYSGSADNAPSSDAVSAKIQRKLDIGVKEGRSIVVTIKVSPKFRGPITVLKKQGKKWKKFKVVRTNARSRASFSLPAPRTGRFYWKFTIRADRAFTTTQSPTYYTYKL